ncbi:MAG: biopolymer transporter ExbD [Pirellulales bacterium]|nr:biopolymer transporter ExbD [Pirellulales bacterium]
MPETPPPPPPPVVDDEMFLDDDVALERKPMRDSGDMDITPMIDIVFLLLIFFLVTSRPDESTTVEMPPARHGQGISQQTAVIITVAKRPGNLPPHVYLADGKVGSPLPDDPEKQEAAIIKAIDTGFNQEAKTSVIIKGDRDLEAGDIYRVAAAVGKAGVDREKIHLHAAVYEED